MKCVSLSLVMLAGATWLALAADAPRLLFTVPYRTSEVATDGKLTEWDSALAVNASALVGSALYPRPCTWFLMWDEQTLYLASRSHLRPNERLIRDRRRPADSTMVVFDDSIEVVLDPMGRDDRHSRYQFLCNTLGIRACLRHTTVPNPRSSDPDADWACQRQFMDWDAPWTPAFSITPDRRWIESEMTVPVATMGVKKNQAGDTWGVVLSRNYKNPWAQASVGGRGGFALPANHARMVLIRGEPFCSLTDLSVSTNAVLQVGLRCHNPTAGDVPFTIEISVRKGTNAVLSEKRTITAKAQSMATDAYSENLGDGPGSRYALDIAVAAAGKPVLRYFCDLEPGFESEALAPFPEHQPYPVIVTPNPWRHECYLRADIIDMPERERVTGLRWRLDTDKGRAIADGLLTKIDHDFIEDTARFPPLTPGGYQMQAIVLAGKDELQTTTESFRRGSLRQLACDFVPGKHERLVFLGDSITEAHLYPLYIEYILRTRYPDRDLEFFNVGIGGDTSGLRMRGGWKALHDDVLVLAPTMVTLMFGMNEKGSPGMEQGILEDFMTSMTFDVEILRNGGPRVAVLCSTPVNRFSDPDWAWQADNAMLIRMKDALGGWCRENGLPFVDLLTPILALSRTERSLDGDPIHPGPPANLAMAGEVLKVMQFQPVVSEVEIDAAHGAVRKATACKVRDVKKTDGGVTFVRQDTVLPLYVPANCRSLLAHVPLLEELSPYRLKVEGLKPGAYSILIDGQKAGETTAEALAQGLNASLLEGPLARQGEMLMGLMRQEHELKKYLWKKYRRGWKVAPPQVPDWQERDQASLEQDIAVLQTKIRQLCRPCDHRWEIVAAEPGR